MEEQHTDRVVELWDRRFGAVEEYTDEWIADSLEEGKPTEAFVAVNGGYVLGFGIATFSTPDYVRDYVDLDVFDRPLPDNCGVLHILCVDEKYEGRGIGTELVKARLRWLAVEGCEAVFGISWHREDHRDSRALFEKFGFDAVETVEEYYRKSQGRAPCPDCGEGCLCDATIYRREL